ncbi:MULTISPECIES: hypothetical protein [unclassified Streptococcus]|uniref:hypothetical protein n=1 Tax=unclassified Streptococcus TaxID=2608887 RepID=UPI0018A94E9A|nr:MULTISPECIES: hypothetical protein [unclassified Streptococcus]MBF8969884.1 hypothetical protein [Streptococcus sp. NLN76]MBG9366895.1 hypothetical protein [Streptococcus sp. NLN64]
MKKKPVFLYVLLGISTLGLLSNIYGFIQRPNVIKTWTEFRNDETIVQQLGGVETINLQIATFEWAGSPLALAMTAVVTVLFGLSAFFLFFKKDVVKSTYTYLAMRLAVFISGVVSIMVSNQMARSFLKNKDQLVGVLNANKFFAIFTVIIFLLLSAIAYFGLRRYQKALEAEVFDGEVL